MKNVLNYVLKKMLISTKFQKFLTILLLKNSSSVSTFQELVWKTLNKASTHDK